MEMMDSINMIMETMGAVASVVAALVAVVGLIECFFGFKLMKLSFAICGFAGGAAIGGVASGLILSEPAPCAIIALVCGLIGALIIYKLYILGIFISNTLLSGVFIFAVLGIAGDMGAGAIGAALIGGVIIGIISCKFVRIWTIITTSLGGGMLAGQSIAVALQISSGIVGTLLGIVIAVLGVLFQLKTTKAKNATENNIAEQQTADLGVATTPVEAIAETPAIETETKEEQNSILVEKAEKSEDKAQSLKEKKLADKSGSKMSVKTIGIVAALVVVLVAGGIVVGGNAGGDRPAGKKPNKAEQNMIWIDEGTSVYGYYEYGDDIAVICYTSADGYKLMNGNGEVIVSSYEEIFDIGEIDGMPWFCVKDFYGAGTFINIYGEEMIDLSAIADANGIYPYISELNSYRYGKLAFDSASGYGVIDTKGNIVVPFTVDCGTMVANEYGTYYIDKSVFPTYGLADASGNIVIPMNHRELYHVNDNLIIASYNGEDSRPVWGAYDASGNIVEPFVHASESDVQAALNVTHDISVSYEGSTEGLDDWDYIKDGFFQISTYDYDTDVYAYGIAKADGTIVIEPVYEYVGFTYEDGLFYAISKEGNITFIDWNGEAKTPEYFFDYDVCDEHERVVKTENGVGIFNQLIDADEEKAYDAYVSQFPSVYAR